MAASAAEPPEVSVVTLYESSSCPVTAMEAVYESSSCPVTAMKAVCEPSSSVCESSSSPESDTEIAYELFSCPHPAEEATYEFSVLSVTAKDAVRKLHDCPVTNELTICPSSLVTAKKVTCELLILPVMNSETMNEISYLLHYFCLCQRDHW